MKKHTSGDRMLTLREAAQLMDVSYTTAARLARAEKFPFIRIGATWRISESVLYEELGLKRCPEGCSGGR